MYIYRYPFDVNCVSISTDTLHSVFYEPRYTEPHNCRVCTDYSIENDKPSLNKIGSHIAKINSKSIELQYAGNFSLFLK